MRNGLTPDVEAKLRSLHTLGLKDAQLAQALGVSHASLKRYKRTLGLGSNCVHNNRGKLGEQAVESLLRAQGYSVAPAPSGHPYDLLVSGTVRVEVKTSMVTEGEWRFKLPENRKSLYGKYRYRKHYREDSDLTVLVGLGKDNSATYWVYRSADLGEQLYTRLDNPATQEHQNAWELFHPFLAERSTHAA